MLSFLNISSGRGAGIQFISPEFFFFFAAVFFLYRLLSHRNQNFLLLAASYLFYASWGPGYLALLIGVTVFQFYCGQRIAASESAANRKFFLLLSLLGGIGTLVFFKYGNILLGGLTASMGGQPPWFRILLPVGLSFYTFQTLSYTIDIYWRRAEPVKRLSEFALFVSFFPQLLAGPIERVHSFLPQIVNPRTVTPEYFQEGGRLIFLGVYQKIFIADNLSRLVEPYFVSPAPYNGVEVLLMVYAFAFQLYCDFAGYSNIARGLAKCLGFELRVNFDTPYLARDPADFWRRWHMSLYGWLRDYVYVPLTYGVERKSYGVAYRSTLIVMLLGALWHGISWNYILWGVFAAAQIIGYVNYRKLRGGAVSEISGIAGAVVVIVKWTLIFHFGVCLGWLIARTTSLQQFYEMASSLWLHFQPLPSHGGLVIKLIFYVWLIAMIEIFQRRSGEFWFFKSWPAELRWAVYTIMAVSMVLFGQQGGKLFIYFQF